MGAISWIIFGAIAGWIASILVGKNAKMGCIANVVVGVIGSMIGGFIAENFLGRSGVTGFNLYSFIVAVGGSVLLLVIVNKLSKNN